MKKCELKIGDVVQIAPSHDPLFGGHFMVVTEPKSWGAQGYVVMLDKDKGLAYYRCKFEHMEYVGKAIWINKSDSESGE